MWEKIEFFNPVFKISQLPKQGYPEIILCGRSNVGKSSFINSLFNKKNLAKTSSTPGKTRSLNYYLIDNKTFLVDLPGFGYAKISQQERDYWKKMIDEYFKSNRNILRAFHLIDSRHPATDLDFQLNQYLREQDIPYVIILNKVDKLKKSEIVLSKKRIINQFPELIFGINLFVYSSVNGSGKTEIRNLFNDLQNLSN